MTTLITAAKETTSHEDISTIDLFTDTAAILN